uniref:Uncharacterized protein n=1 Tax=Utricularia reniformis TaxID=192314 RepID=A0A1Y0B284_9LAMI|nr:hypothetical protein AEK19_MT1278 [Utricularia reniformis]ART31483.1 hypothetical protein AEK19_MT1278 [Utricularia reniformis]
MVQSKKKDSDHYQFTNAKCGSFRFRQLLQDERKGAQAASARDITLGQPRAHLNCSQCSGAIVHARSDIGFRFPIPTNYFRLQHPRMNGIPLCYRPQQSSK